MICGALMAKWSDDRVQYERPGVGSPLSLVVLPVTSVQTDSHWATLHTPHFMGSLLGLAGSLGHTSHTSLHGIPAWTGWVTGPHFTHLTSWDPCLDWLGHWATLHTPHFMGSLLGLAGSLGHTSHTSLHGIPAWTGWPTVPLLGRLLLFSSHSATWIKTASGDSNHNHNLTPVK